MADSAPWLLVGLGNPGSRYAKNRHNVGFMGVDAFAEAETPVVSWRKGFKGEHLGLGFGSQRCVALKPQTYMNRSGESVAAAMAFHKTKADRLIVVHDELDFEFGRLALKEGGGHGGHNGLRDIIAKIGTRDFVRLRLGIGRPRHGDVSNWVLSDFVGEDADFVPELLERAVEALRCLLKEGVRNAMNRFNTSAA